VQQARSRTLNWHGGSSEEFFREAAMTRCRRTLRAAPLAIGAVFLALSASGEIYRWTDAAGRIHFTEQIDKVPRAHREEARRNAESESVPRLQTYSGSTGGPAAVAPRRAVSRSGKIEIPFVRVGTLMRVEAVVNDLVRVPFLVDTGASGVSLPSSYAERLGIRIRPDDPYVTVSTANGVVARPIVTLRSVQVSGARVENITTTVNPAMDIGLLGGAFFNNYIYSVDAAKGVITLVPNAQIRGGFGPDEWRSRFRIFVDPIERIDAYLRDHPNLRRVERRHLDARRIELEASLEELEHQANRLGVPQMWRR
jgi:clan AA aspartic protease (TIGR02281 family)